MQGKIGVIVWLILFFAVDGFTKPPPPSNIIKTDVVTVSVEPQYDFVCYDSDSALAVHFELAEGWHFYASAKTAPGGMSLKIKPSSQPFMSFSEPIFPSSELYFDKTLGQKLEVFSGKFTVFLPFKMGQVKFRLGPGQSYNDIKIHLKISIEGAVCSGLQCRMPDFGELGIIIPYGGGMAKGEPKFVLPDVAKAAPQGEQTQIGQWVNYSAWFALGLALLAGLSLNIMPCVWPVLPIIVMRIIEQAKAGRKQSIVMGFAFCLGILLFFACLAGANIILQVFYGTVLQWADPFRNPAFLVCLALLLVVLALFMFGVFTIGVPSAITGKSGSGKGYSGSVGMGFLAAVLSTPCSFAILAAAFAWAQAQSLPLGTIAIMTIGLGMAVPYVILTSMPGLLKRLPKAGRWMELFKQTMGFVLLIIAVKLITALPQVRRMGVLYFAVVLGFCVWMWGGWVDYNTRLLRKCIIRVIAIILAIAAGFAFLPAPEGELVDWQKYDADLIETAITQERPVLIKFTADWCLTCQAVNKIVYARKDIARLIEEKNVLVIKADTTVKKHPATFALKDVYNEPGVPVSMLFVPGKEEPVRWRNIFFADELKTLLQKLPSQ